MRLILAALALVVYAAPAMAEPARGARPPAQPEVRERLSGAVLPYSRRDARLPEGIARTAVERREGGVTTSAGFLCGREDIAVAEGSAGAYERDPHGRFVGASVRMRF